MSFSEKMRESLGAEGVRLDVASIPDAIPRGGLAHARVIMRGGTKSARVERILIRVIEADRYWRDTTGVRLSEADASRLVDRRHLTAAWDRRVIGESELTLFRDIDAHSLHELDVDVPIPARCRPTDLTCSHTLNLQADIRGQIDPTGNARIVVS